MSGFKIPYHNTSPIFAHSAHGFQEKTLVVLHETVSPDIKGWADEEGVENYLKSKGYGIHGVTDAEGNIGWALGLGKAVFWQAGGVNSQSIGIEQVSRVMLQSPSNAVRRAIWKARDKQLHATAMLLAAIHRAHRIPLTYVDGDGKRCGVTSHWSVSRHFAASQGHTDCWPVNDGGYYPTGYVLQLARNYVKKGAHF